MSSLCECTWSSGSSLFAFDTRTVFSCGDQVLFKTLSMITGKETYLIISAKISSVCSCVDFALSPFVIEFATIPLPKQINE